MTREDHMERLEAALRSGGQRVTAQRRAILRVLEAARDHPDAVEIHARAARDEPSVSLATVYRALAALEAAHVLQKLEFGEGPARYELTNRAHHDHMVDVETGEITEFRSDAIEELQRRIVAEMGLELVDHRLTLYVRRG